jgi:DNA-binding MarR family transcriptional regulator
MMDDEGKPRLSSLSKDQLVERFVELSHEISLQVRPTLLAAWSDIELTMHQFRALTILSNSPLRVSDVAAQLGIRLSSATNLVDRLESKNLLRRTPDSEDRRVVWCQLTDLGHQEAESLWSINRGSLEGVATRLTNEELGKAVQAFEILSAALRRTAQQQGHTHNQIS